MDVSLGLSDFEALLVAAFEGDEKARSLAQLRQRAEPYFVGTRAGASCYVLPDGSLRSAPPINSLGGEESQRAFFRFVLSSALSRSFAALSARRRERFDALPDPTGLPDGVRDGRPYFRLRIGGRDGA